MDEGSCPDSSFRLSCLLACFLSFLFLPSHSFQNPVDECASGLLATGTAARNPGAAEVRHLFRSYAAHAHSPLSLLIEEYGIRDSAKWCELTKEAGKW